MNFGHLVAVYCSLNQPTVPSKFQCLLNSPQGLMLLVTIIRNNVALLNFEVSSCLPKHSFILLYLHLANPLFPNCRHYIQPFGIPVQKLVCWTDYIQTPRLFCEYQGGRRHFSVELLFHRTLNTEEVENMSNVLLLFFSD